MGVRDLRCRTRAAGRGAPRRWPLRRLNGRRGILASGRRPGDIDAGGFTMARALAEVVDGLRFRTSAWIDGQFVPAVGGRTYVSENPATGQPLAEVALGGAEGGHRAGAAARRAC